MSQRIEAICWKVFDVEPDQIQKQKIGICNEVYRVTMDGKCFIVRYNTQKGEIFGTHKFLPIFKSLEIKTPEIIAEDYSKSEIDVCYQVLSCIEGDDLGVVIDQLTKDQLGNIAQEVSQIFDKFKSLDADEAFGMLSGAENATFTSMLDIVQQKRAMIIERNQKTGVIGEGLISDLNNLIEKNKEYFEEVKPGVYYDDICSKNIMIRDGVFSGLVDLDFLMRGDYLEAIGRIMASWYGTDYGAYYTDTVMRAQQLSDAQRHMVKVYAALTLFEWLSEEGIQFNSNSSGKVDQEQVQKKTEKLQQLLEEM